MTRWGMALNLAAGLALLAALGAAAAGRRQAPWRGYQQRYLALADDEAHRELQPHRISLPAFDALDRCTTCHLGLEPAAESFDEAPFTDPADAREVHRSHQIGRFGCTSCHGGQGRALSPELAHDRRLESGGWSAFTAPQVRCARCHPQGGSRSPQGQRGAELYLSQGCSGCHQPGRLGPGIGPDLATIGLRGRAELARVLLSPDQVYPQTVMPPQRYFFDEEGEEIEALVTFLQGLEPWPRGGERRERRFAPEGCARCHRVDRSDAHPVGEGHRCPHILAEAQWLACARCHQPPATEPEAALEEPDGEADAEPAALPARPPLPPPAAPTVDDPGGACPVLQAAFSTCGVCHHQGER